MNVFARGSLEVVAWLGAATMLSLPAPARACGTCRGASDTGSAFTAPDERWSLSLGSLARYETGTWDATGRFHAEPSRVSAWDVTGQLALGVRIVRPIELAVMAGAGVARLSAPGLESVTTGLTDLTLRTRVDVLADDPSQPSRPAVGTWFTVRAPMGSVGTATPGGGTAAVGAFGLGAWEVAVGGDVRRTFAERWQPFLAVEGAVRAPDRSLGVPRALGPRMGIRTGITWFASDVVAFSALADLALEGDAALGGENVPNSWQQRVGVGLAATARVPNGLRFSLATWADVPVDAMGRNGSATLRLAFAIGYASPEPAWRACPAGHHGMTMAMR